MPEKINNKGPDILILCFFGILIRFWAMSLGHNYDFDSYCIVGELAGNLQNVYAVTDRYNYAPLFMCIQGSCFRLSQLLSQEPVATYRVLIVGILTFTDLGIMRLIWEKYSLQAAVLFFLNPVSVIITGYHNQFDNMAVLFALLSCRFYNEQAAWKKKDTLFVGCLTISLLIKHILWIFPFWLLVRKGLPLKKKLVYAVVPPFIFLMSFVPFGISDKAACRGILNNVFFYRSHNNAPLLGWLFHMANVPAQYWFVIFMLLLLLSAWVFRSRAYEYQIMMYLVAAVAFSSAIANQYLVIPAAALCVLGCRGWRDAYLVSMGVFLALDEAGFGLIRNLEDTGVQNIFINAIRLFHRQAYRVGVCILALFLVKELWMMYGREKKEWKNYIS